MTTDAELIQLLNNALITHTSNAIQTNAWLSVPVHFLKRGADVFMVIINNDLQHTLLMAPEDKVELGDLSKNEIIRVRMHTGTIMSAKLKLEIDVSEESAQQ